VVELLNVPGASTYDTPAPKYTPPANAIYAIWPSNSQPGNISTADRLYSDGTITSADGTIKSTGNQNTFNWVMNYKDTPTGIPNGWTIGKDNSVIQPSNVSWNGTTATYSSTPVPTAAQTNAAAQTQTQTKTPVQINANPIDLTSVINGISSGQGLNWNLSTWTSSANGTFTQQPVLTINGQQYTFQHPQSYIYALQELQSTGATGNFNQFINEFQNVLPAFAPTTVTGSTQNYSQAVQQATQAYQNQQTAAQQSTSQATYQLLNLQQLINMQI
jgi:hypothetical protein